MAHRPSTKLSHEADSSPANDKDADRTPKEKSKTDRCIELLHIDNRDATASSLFTAPARFGSKQSDDGLTRGGSSALAQSQPARREKNLQPEARAGLSLATKIGDIAAALGRGAEAEGDQSGGGKGGGERDEDGEGDSERCGRLRRRHHDSLECAQDFHQRKLCLRDHRAADQAGPETGIAHSSVAAGSTRAGAATLALALCKGEPKSGFISGTPTCTAATLAMRYDEQPLAAACDGHAVDADEQSANHTLRLDEQVGADASTGNKPSGQPDSVVLIERESQDRRQVTMANGARTFKRKNRVGYVKAPTLGPEPAEAQEEAPCPSDYGHSESTTAGTLPPSSADCEPCAAIECEQLRYQVTEINLNDFFNYKQREILHAINLTVPEGSIYGLLGPSGCGKTTLLKCVAGRLQPTSGTVRVFGFEPGEAGSQIPGPAIGFMPQELSIYEEFTINETLTYFGMINRVPKKLISKRVEFLLRFLDLPDKRRLVRTLSGGQKRRVSLAAALVHSPPLLILDEPTVGVDPLLREVIWDYLVQLAKSDKITIIITTHYVEEARQADVVGLMRHGNLLAEDSPEKLMLRHNAVSLEHVFLNLCMLDKQAERLKKKKLSDTVKGDEQFSDQLLQSTINNDNNNAGKKLHNKSIFSFERAVNTVSQDTEIDTNRDINRISLVPPLATVEPSLSNTLMSRESLNSSSSSNGTIDLNKSYSLTTAVNKQLPGACCPSPVSADQVTLMIDDANLEDNSTVLVDGSTGHVMGLAGSVGLSERQRVVNDQQERKFRSMNKGSKYMPRRTTPLHWLEVLWAVIWKNHLRLKRNPPVIIFEFLLPAFQVLLFCLCIGGDPFNIPLAIVNEESVPQASRLFLNAINKQSFNQIHFGDLGEALESVEKGKTWGVVHIPERYTKNLQDRLFNPADATNETLRNGTIRIYPDLTNLHLALAMENTFREAFIKFSRETLDLFGYDPQLAELPIKMEKPIYGGIGTKPSYLEFMAPGVIISITYVMATGLTALAFILEKRDGLLERSQISGVTSNQILLAHFSLQVFVMMFQIGLVLLVTFFIFDIPSHGPFHLAVLLILLQGCTGMACGLVISAVCNEENTAVMMLVGTFYINLILAGVIWPLEAMPQWLRWFSYAQPQTLPVEALRNVLSRGWDFSEPGVHLGFVVSIGWLVALIVGAGVCMRYLK